MAFMRIQGFGKCTGISFVDSTMIPICHNMRRNFNKVFDGLAKNGKETMGWCHGFKLHLLCNEMGDVLTFCLTPANVDDRDPKVWQVFTKVLYGKVFADKGYIKQKFFENLFNQGIHLVHGLKSNMKKQAYALVGQDDALQAIYNRMHQRTAQEQGQPCSFTPSLRA